MGCSRSKNKSQDDVYPGAEAEGGSRRTTPSNESLIITVLWRRLSMFSRRGSVRKTSAAKAATNLKTASVTRAPELGAAEAPPQLQPEELTLSEESTLSEELTLPEELKRPKDLALPELDEDGENR